MNERIVFSTQPEDFDYMDINVPCQEACPAYTNIPAYIRCVFEETEYNMIKTVRRGDGAKSHA